MLLSNATSEDHPDWTNANLEAIYNDGGESSLFSMLLSHQVEKLSSVMTTLRAGSIAVGPDREAEIAKFLHNRNIEPRATTQAYVFQVPDEEKLLRLLDRSQAEAILDAIDTDADAFLTPIVRAGDYNVKVSFKRSVFLFGRTLRRNNALHVLMQTGHSHAANTLMQLYSATCPR